MFHPSSLLVAAALVGLGNSASADAVEGSPELIQPAICSTATAGLPPLAVRCSATALDDGQHDIRIKITAETEEIRIGEYRLTTENYNGEYVTPVIEAMPGDTVSATLTNLLSTRVRKGAEHHHGGSNPTNLHYFHGGIVSPNNARPKPVELGNGDNVYVHLNSGLDAKGVPNRFDYKVPIPGEQTLDARVLEGQGYIAHPTGLNWYHSHLHGISADQVTGGMSGLLSVGEATANVRASCLPDSAGPSKCKNDVEKDTVELRKSTDVRYAILRDIMVRNISALPGETANATADWDLERSASVFPATEKCGVWMRETSKMDTDDVTLRKGFCQREQDSAWLFTINGQRFPTITVQGGRNLLLRLGNLSANVSYWLELRNEADGSVLPLTILGLDGVVPARPVSPENATKPIEAINVSDLLVMPASRLETYIRNDEKVHADRQVYVLSTKGLNTGTDIWPAIQLARIVLEPNVNTSTTEVALNVPVEETRAELQDVLPPTVERIEMPEGCIRDIDPAFLEYRRVTFLDGKLEETWQVKTDIIRPNPGVPKRESAHKAADGTSIGPFPFEDYVGADGKVDWTKPHTCIFIDSGNHANSHKQLWVLVNGTKALHNFHIHQMKFRFATKTELAEHLIIPPEPSQTCSDPSVACAQPNYRFYDDENAGVTGSNPNILWHDTIPMPPLSRVYIVMSFDAQEQVGRFVYHCHVLKHEDKGLMAPIEVWQPTTTVAEQ